MGWETHHPPPPFSPRGFWGAHGAGCGLGVLYPEQLWKSSRVALEGLGRLVPAAPGGWVGGGSKSTLPPPKKPSVGQCRVPGALQGPQPPGYPQPHGSHPMGQPQSPPPHPITNPSPTAPTPWVSRAPQLPSHPVRSHLAPKGWRSRPPRTNLGAQPHAGSGQQCPAVVNPSTQGRSILPWHSGDLCLSFPRLQREGGWLGGWVRLPHRGPAITQPALRRDGSAAGGGIAVGCSGGCLVAHTEHRTARKGDYF